MKLASLCTLCLTLFGTAYAQDSDTNAVVRIPASAAAQHINAEAVVTGKVVEVNKAEKIIRLNFEKAFPRQPFTAVVFSTKTNLFPDIDALKDKQVEVSGRISEYRGRPQIILTSTNQLRMVTGKPTE